jgi:hypothetical protein
VLTRAWLILLLTAVFWFDLPIEHVYGPGADNAAFAKGSNSGSGSGGSGSSGSGSGSGSSGGGGSGSGSSGGGHDDDGSDDHSGSGGGGNSGPGGGTSAPGPTGAAAAGGRVGKGPLLTGGGGIHVQYSDGRIERIRASIFETLDPRGRLVERHPATRQDERRLKSLETTLTRNGRQSGLLVVAEIDERAGTAEITDFRGWRESMSGGRYVLSDPDGRTVARRSLMASDIARLRAMLFLD